MKPACDRCNRVHGTDEVRAVGRFTTVTGYRDMSGNLHKTREAAEDANCKENQ